MKAITFICIFSISCLIYLVFFSKCKKTDGKGNINYTNSMFNCPQYGPWPGQNDCGGWVNYLSAGYPTVKERGVQANNMQLDPEWQNICSNDQMDQINANTYAYGLNATDVFTAVNGINGNITDRKTLCQIATNILTPPVNQCQVQDWKNNYMSTMDSGTQKLLNLWKSYC